MASQRDRLIARKASRDRPNGSPVPCEGRSTASSNGSPSNESGAVPLSSSENH
jgi:hypothetical protein